MGPVRKDCVGVEKLEVKVDGAVISFEATGSNLHDEVRVLQEDSYEYDA